MTVSGRDVAPVRLVLEFPQYASAGCEGLKVGVTRRAFGIKARFMNLKVMLVWVECEIVTLTLKVQFCPLIERLLSNFIL